MSANPLTKSIEFQSLEQSFNAISSLLSGTSAMRDAGESYLPKFPTESTEAYKVRLSVSTLYPAVKETIRQMCGRVFFKPLNTESITEQITPFIEDIDGQGNEVKVFLSKVFASMLAFGRGYVVVEHTYSDGIRTRAEEKTFGARPYALFVPANQVLSVQREMINGVPRISQLRYIQSVIVPDGEWGEKSVDEVVVYDLSQVRKYRKAEDAWMLHDQAELLIKNKPLTMPIVVEFVLDQQPPLLELVHLNIKHWQSQSDQDNILHIARSPIIAQIGVDQEYDKDGNPLARPMTINAMHSLPHGADMKYVEHSGAAIEAGQKSLDMLEQHMRDAGAKLLTRTKLALTDSQARDERDKEISLLRLYADLLEDATEQMLDVFAMWLGVDGGGKIEISGNLDSEISPEKTMDTIIKMTAIGALSEETAFLEAKRRGIVSEERDWDVERAKINEENDEHIAENEQR